MRRVDFLGPPAVGKSTTYMAALERRQDDAGWHTREEATALIGEQRIPGGREWRRYLQYCERLATHPPEGVEQKLATKLVAMACDAAAVEASPLPGLAVFDESLSLRGMSLAIRHDHMMRFAGRYFQDVPPPAGVVYWYADAEVITDRLEARTRKGRMPRMQGLDRTALLEVVRQTVEVARLGADELERRRIPILRLDATRSSDHLAADLQQFLAFLAQAAQRKPPLMRRTATLRRRRFKPSWGSDPHWGNSGMSCVSSVPVIAGLQL